MGKVCAFQGTLNPLSGLSIFETYAIPVLLYGCETWILDHPCLMALEKFQAEIGKCILHLPHHHANAVRVGVYWPSVALCILIHKLTYLLKLMPSDNQLSAKVFSSLAIEDIILQNLHCVGVQSILEDLLVTFVLAQCLSHPHDAPWIMRQHQPNILKQDFETILVSPSSYHAVHKANLWCHPQYIMAENMGSCTWWRCQGNKLNANFL